MAFVTSVPNKITTDEVEFGASISEEQATKVAAAINFFIDYHDFVKLGITGGSFASLIKPYELTNNAEIINRKYEISDLDITIGDTGTTSNSSFKIKRKRSGVWLDLYTISVDHSSGSGLVFKNTDTVSGISQNLLLNSLELGDILVFEITSANDSFRNITAKINLRPIE